MILLGRAPVAIVRREQETGVGKARIARPSAATRINATQERKARYGMERDAVFKSPRQRRGRRSARKEKKGARAGKEPRG